MTASPALRASGSSSSALRASGSSPALGSALDDQLQGYLDHLTIERGVAVNTLSSYRRDLRRYAEHLAERGIDDLAKVTEIEPDLVILDLMLGPTELQGWALLQKLRMSPPTEDLPVIVCTAATNWVREQEGWLAANAVKVVLKPFKVQHLEHAIQQALDLPTVTASAELSESESTGQASTPPGPAKG